MKKLSYDRPNRNMGFDTDFVKNKDGSIDVTTKDSNGDDVTTHYNNQQHYDASKDPQKMRQYQQKLKQDRYKAQRVAQFKDEDWDKNSWVQLTRNQRDYAHQANQQLKNVQEIQRSKWFGTLANFQQGYQAGLFFAPWIANLLTGMTPQQRQRMAMSSVYSGNLPQWAAKAARLTGFVPGLLTQAYLLKGAGSAAIKGLGTGAKFLGSTAQMQKLSPAMSKWLTGISEGKSGRGITGTIKFLTGDLKAQQAAADAVMGGTRFLPRAMTAVSGKVSQATPKISKWLATYADKIKAGGKIQKFTDFMTRAGANLAYQGTNLLGQRMLNYLQNKMGDWSRYTPLEWARRALQRRAYLGMPIGRMPADPSFQLNAANMPQAAVAQAPKVVSPHNVGPFFGQLRPVKQTGWGVLKTIPGAYMPDVSGVRSAIQNNVYNNTNITPQMARQDTMRQYAAKLQDIDTALKLLSQQVPQTQAQYRDLIAKAQQLQQLKQNITGKATEAAQNSAIQNLKNDIYGKTFLGSLKQPVDSFKRLANIPLDLFGMQQSGILPGWAVGTAMIAPMVHGGVSYISPSAGQKMMPIMKPLYKAFEFGQPVAHQSYIQPGGTDPMQGYKQFVDNYDTIKDVIRDPKYSGVMRDIASSVALQRMSQLLGVAQPGVSDTIMKELSANDPKFQQKNGRVVSDILTNMSTDQKQKLVDKLFNATGNIGIKNIAKIMRGLSLSSSNVTIPQDMKKMIQDKARSMIAQQYKLAFGNMAIGHILDTLPDALYLYMNKDKDKGI